MGYIPAKFPHNSVGTNELKKNIFFKGIPTCNTPSVDTSDNAIATTKFVHELIQHDNTTILNPNSSFVATITGSVINSVTNIVVFEHITSSTYQITTKTNFIVENFCDLTLPDTILQGSIVTIVNRSGTIINVNSGSNIMYNNFYLGPNGGILLQINNNSTAYITFIVNSTTNVKSWAVSIY